MIAWLTDTFVYTGLLIALVLLLRRAVGRHFGPQIAYALWALPLLRLAIPPITLPASLAPAAATPVSTTIQPAMAHQAAIFVPGGTDSSVPWAAIAVATWLFGAVLFLAWRCHGYFRVRRDLLAGSRPVGEVGKVRLVETRTLGSPVAFGVFDKVVALPLEFMALDDRAARDMAIEHELAHHDGRDLLANVLAQPLLALHWFNPVAWIGWRAMRRDQEAACDARVIARRTPAERAHYGRVIASFAAGPRLALAAPMACPMAGRLRGEKSIVHRLRSLKMAEVSPRRRLAGRLLLAGAALALPLTASVGYAVAPASAAAESSTAPVARTGAVALVAPSLSEGHRYALRTRRLPKGGEVVTMTVLNVAPDSGSVGTDRSTPKGDGLPIPPVPPMPPAPPAPPMPPTAPLSEAQQKTFTEMGRQWAQWGKEMSRRFNAEWARQWRDSAEKMQQAALKQAGELQSTLQVGGPGALALVSPGVQMNCADDTSAELCRQYARATARDALEHARSGIAADPGLPDAARAEALRSLDDEIGRLDHEGDPGAPSED